MSAIDDLNSAVTNLEASSAALITAAKASDQSLAIQAAVARIAAVTANEVAAVTPPVVPTA